MKTLIKNRTLEVIKEFGEPIFLNTGDTIICNEAIYEVENKTLDLNKNLLIINVRQVY